MGDRKPASGIRHWLLEMGGIADKSCFVMLCGTRGLKHWRKINGFGNNYFGWGGEAFVRFDKGYLKVFVERVERGERVEGERNRAEFHRVLKRRNNIKQAQNETLVLTPC